MSFNFGTSSDQQQSNKQQQPNINPFSSFAQQPQANVFGQTAPQPPTFGSTSFGGLSGGFGSSTGIGNVSGQNTAFPSATSSVFGQPPQATSIFGQPSSATNQPAAPSSSAAATGSFLFGQPQQQPALLFGSSQQQQPQKSFFGSSGATFGTAPAASALGSNTTTTGGIGSFGLASSAPSASNNSVAGGGLFGAGIANAPSAFSMNAGGANPATAGPFGAMAAPVANTSALGSAAQISPATAPSATTFGSVGGNLFGQTAPQNAGTAIGANVFGSSAPPSTIPPLFGSSHQPAQAQQMQPSQQSAPPFATSSSNLAPTNTPASNASLFPSFTFNPPPNSQQSGNPPAVANKPFSFGPAPGSSSAPTASTFPAGPTTIPQQPQQKQTSDPQRPAEPFKFTFGAAGSAASPAVSAVPAPNNPPQTAAVVPPTADTALQPGAQSTAGDEKKQTLEIKTGQPVTFPSALKGKTLEEIVVSWQEELEDQINRFQGIARDLSKLDKQIMSNEEAVLTLIERVGQVETWDAELEQFLAFLAAQQAELEGLLELIEKELPAVTEALAPNVMPGGTMARLSPADAQRDRLFEMAESLQDTLSDVSANLSEMICESNLQQTQQTQHPIEPAIMRILNEQMESLLWIDKQLDDLKRTKAYTKRLAEKAHCQQERLWFR